MKRRRARGEGSLKERKPGVWLLTFDLGTVNGRRKQRSVTVRGNERQARTELRLLLAARDEKRMATADGRLTFATYAERWLTNHEESGKVRPQTAAWYRRILRVHVLPVAGPVKLRDIDAEDLRGVLRSVRSNGKSLRTRQAVYSALRTVFRRARRENLIPTNPMELVDPPSGESRKVEVPPVNVVRSMLKSLEHLPYGLAFRILAFSGMRRGEVYAPRWESVDFGQSTIIVESAAAYTPDGVEVFDPKTRAGTRVVTMDPESMSMLRHHRAKQARTVLAAGGAIQDSGFVFTSPDGSILKPQRLTDNWVQARKKHGWAWTLHSLRHCHATQLLAAGTPINTVQTRLGHSRASITLDVYASSLPAHDKIAASVFARVMTGEN